MLDLKRSDLPFFEALTGSLLETVINIIYTKWANNYYSVIKSKKYNRVGWAYLFLIPQKDSLVIGLLKSLLKQHFSVEAKSHIQFLFPAKMDRLLIIYKHSALQPIW